MSWLSKLVGGKTLKIAAIAAAGYAGKNYIWGSTIPTYDTSGPGGFGRIGATYSEDTFAGRMFNKAGITPFSETRVGSFLSPVTEFLSPDSMGGVTQAARALTANQRFDQQPSASTISPTGVRSDTNFIAGQTRMMPIGNGGQVGNALNNPNAQQYFAKQVRMMSLPAVQGLPAAASVSSSSLATTTSARRRSYKAMTGS